MSVKVWRQHNFFFSGDEEHPSKVRTSFCPQLMKDSRLF